MAQSVLPSKLAMPVRYSHPPHCGVAAAGMSRALFRIHPDSARRLSMKRPEPPAGIDPVTPAGSGHTTRLGQARPATGQ
jgi:hypothetical protein